MNRTEGGAVEYRKRLRMSTVGLLATMLVVLGATAAGAQERDPFDPLLGESTDATSTAPTGGAVVEPAPAPPPAPAPAEQLPATGADPTSWVVVALALVCAGAGITVVARSFGTQAALSAISDRSGKP